MNWKIVNTWRFDHEGNQHDEIMIVDENNVPVLSGKKGTEHAQLMVNAPGLFEENEEMKSTLSLINSVANAHTGRGDVGSFDWEDIRGWTKQYRLGKED